MQKKKASAVTSYNKWGYFFLIPFIVIFLIFQLIPLVSTVYYSFFENYRSGLKQIGPNFVGLGNYAKLLSQKHFLTYFKNTMIMWVMGFMVHRSVPETQGPEILQDSHLPAEPDHGFRFRDALLRTFRRQRPGQLDPYECRHTRKTLQVHVPCVERQRAGRLHELPHVVRKYDDPPDGRYARYRLLAL